MTDEIIPATWTRSVMVLDLKPFIVFGDPSALTMEPVNADDLAPITIQQGSFFASCAWSSDVHWYFIVMDDGLALLSVASGCGFYCRKKSAMFIELFLSAPRRR